MSDQHDDSHNYDNHNDHHEHGPTPAYTQRQLSKAENKAQEVRAKAIESLLEEDDFVTPQDLDAVLEAYENDIGPLNGAKVVARAWVDPAFKERLLLNGAAQEIVVPRSVDDFLLLVERGTSDSGKLYVARGTYDLP